MKTYMILSMMLAGVLISAVVFAAPADRFKGASYDGYDQRSYVQTSGTNSYPLIYARFTGGTYDGYDMNSVTNIAIPGVGGTLFFFW
jgi:hypothetical protein